MQKCGTHSQYKLRTKKEQLLHSHLLRRCTNVEVLSDVVKQVVFITFATNQNHRVLSNLMSDIPFAWSEMSVQNHWNNKLNNGRKQYFNITLMEQWLYRGSSREKFSVVSRLPEDGIGSFCILIPLIGQRYERLPEEQILNSDYIFHSVL